MIIAVDFDGTLAEHRFPDIGKEVPHAFNTLKALQQRQVKLILLTMRHAEWLDEAVKWCSKRGIIFDYINDNPEQLSWTNSRKVYAHHYIDDAAIGCPLIYPINGDKPYVDWAKVNILLEKVC